MKAAEHSTCTAIGVIFFSHQGATCGKHNTKGVPKKKSLERKLRLRFGSQLRHKTENHRERERERMRHELANYLSFDGMAPQNEVAAGSPKTLGFDTRHFVFLLWFWAQLQGVA